MDYLGFFIANVLMYGAVRNAPIVPSLFLADTNTVIPPLPVWFTPDRFSPARIIYNPVMKRSLERIILKIPYPLLRKVLYIYVGAVIFWDSAPVVSIVLWGVIIINLLVIKFQSELWISNTMAEHSSGRVGYVERLRAPIRYSGPRILLLLAAGALLGYFLNGQFGLSGVQIFALVVGYMLFYRETTLLFPCAEKHSRFSVPPARLGKGRWSITLSV
jgi:hypothetical protein